MATTTAPKQASKAPSERAKLKPEQIQALTVVFEKAENFLKFLQTLPPNKLLASPQDDPARPVMDGGGLWEALSWMLRDNLDLPRYTDPDFVAGAEVTHFHKGGHQSFDIGMQWIWPIFYALPRGYRESIPAATLALIVKQLVEDEGKG